MIRPGGVKGVCARSSVVNGARRALFVASVLLLSGCPIGYGGPGLGTPPQPNSIFVDVKPEPVPSAKERLLRVIADCRPPYPVRLLVRLSYDRGLTRVLDIFPQENAPRDTTKALTQCLQLRSEQLGTIDQLQQVFDIEVGYPDSAQRFPFPIPTPAGRPLELGACDDHRLERLESRLKASGYKTRHLAFLDGVAIATAPEQLDPSGSPLQGPGRFAELKTDCWEVFGWFDGLFRSCLVKPPSERVRTFAFLCASTAVLPTLDYQADDPAVAMKKLTSQGNLRLIRLPDPRPRQLYLAEYRYERGPGDTNFKELKARDVTEDVPIPLDGW
jgi:hypothetical protein